MTHFDKLDLVELAEDRESSELNHILAVTETFIEVGDTFFIGKHPAPLAERGDKSDASSKYKVDAVIDVVEVSFLNYRIRASKI